MKTIVLKKFEKLALIKITVSIWADHCFFSRYNYVIKKIHRKSSSIALLDSCKTKSAFRNLYPYIHILSPIKLKFYAFRISYSIMLDITMYN